MGSPGGDPFSCRHLYLSLVLISLPDMNKPVIKMRYKVLACIVLFFAVIMFAAPRVAKHYVVKHSYELLGRSVSIDKIRLNYFTGTLRIDGLKLFEQDGKTIFVSFERLKVNLDYIPLLRNEIFVKYISLEAPYAQVLQNGEKFNFSDLTEKTDSSTVENDTVASSPTKYIINNIGISRGYLKYTDQVLDHTIAMNNLDLSIPGFTWNSDSTNLNVNFRFVDGGGLYSKLEINQADSTYSLNLRLDSLHLDIIEPYIQSNMYISAMHGYLSNDIRIKGNMQSIMQMIVSGVNHIYGLQLTDTLNRTIFSFKELTIDVDTVMPASNRIDINSVSLSDPFILFELVDTTNNWMALLKPTPEAQSDSLSRPADTTGSNASFSYTFPKLAITGGKITFSDKTLRYPFDYNIENLTIDCSESPGERNKLSLRVSAGLNGTGNLNVNATLNPASMEDFDLALSVGQFRMKDLEPYFLHYLGYPVTGGIMNFKTDDRMMPGSLTSNNSLYFRKFSLAERTDKNCEYKIPVRLAIGVLSDKDGIIDLKAPVESKGDEVKVRNLGRIIFRIIGNLFVKAAVSPFNALAGAFNADPASLQEIRLGLTEPQPDEDNMKSVDIIADILKTKPGLNAEFYYCIDRNKAADSLSYLLAIKDFTDYSKSTGIQVRNVADSTLLKYLLEKPFSTDLKENPQLFVLCRKYIGETKLDNMLDSIRNLQTAFMTSYLGTDKALPADRFKVISVSPDTIRPPLNYPAFKTYFNAGD